MRTQKHNSVDIYNYKFDNGLTNGEVAKFFKTTVGYVSDHIRYAKYLMQWELDEQRGTVPDDERKLNISQYRERRHGDGINSRLPFVPDTQVR